MADYYSVLTRAIESLRPDTAETRRVLYERAEQTLLAQLRALDPPASEDEIQAQTKSLTDAIARIEAEHAVSEALSGLEPEIVDADQEPEARDEPEVTDAPEVEDKPEPDGGDAAAQPDEADASASDEAPEMSRAAAASPVQSASSGDTDDTKAETPSVTPSPLPAAPPPRPTSLPDPARLEVKHTPAFETPAPTSDADAGSGPSGQADTAPSLSGAQRPGSPFRTPPRLSTGRPGLTASIEDRAARGEADRVEPSLGATGRSTPSAAGVYRSAADRPDPLEADAPAAKTDTPKVDESTIGDLDDDQPRTDGDSNGRTEAGRGEAADTLSGGVSDAAPPSDPFMKEPGGRRRGGGWALLLVLLIVVGLIGGGVYWFRGPILQWSDAILEMISAPSTEDASDKIEDRLTEPGEEAPADDTAATTDTAGTNTGETSTTPGVLESGVAEAQLIEQNEDEPNSPDRTPGTVRWQTEGSGDQLELVGSVDVPGRGMAMSMRFAKNTDETFPATHTIIFQFSLSPEFEHGGVQDVPRLLLKQTAQSSGNALVTDVIPLDDNAFLMALSGVDLDAERNLTELKSRPFLDVPLIYTDGRLAILTIAKGAQGDRAFADAFAAWGQ